MLCKTRGHRAFNRVIKSVAVTLLAAPAAFAGKPPPPPPPPGPPPPPAPVTVNGSQFFSWFQTSSDQTYPIATFPSGTTNGTYIGTPFLTDGNAAAVNAYLMSLPAGAIRA